MTHMEMFKVIQNYCKDDCENCVIEKLCTPISGRFSMHEEDCKRAYEIITEGKACPQFVKCDNVNHPKHYESGKFECIDVMCEALGEDGVKDFCLCNAFKYIYRCKHKHDSPVEDVKKARWYLTKFLELEGALDD